MICQPKFNLNSEMERKREDVERGIHAAESCVGQDRSHRAVATGLSAA
jgi:hypothetical protein